MEGSKQENDSSAEENMYLDMIMETSIKKDKAQPKDKSGKGGYKLNLSADLMGSSTSPLYS